MKKNLLALGAVIFALVLSSFTVKTSTTYYLVYNGGAIEKSMSSFNTPTTIQPSHVNNGVGKLNWFRVIDQDNDGVEQTEFDTDFDSYDFTSPGSDKLSDEVDVLNQLDVKRP